MDLYLNAYKNQQREIKEAERFIERFRYKNTKATQVQSRIKKLEKLEILEEPSEDNSSIRLKIPQPERSPLRIVSCEKVGKSYGDVEVFNDLESRYAKIKIEKNTLVTKALSIMNEKKITSLLVVSDKDYKKNNKKLKGIIHIHSLLENGIK